MDLAGVHCAAVDVLTDDAVRLGVGVDDVAGGLHKVVKGVRVGAHREGRDRAFARLYFEV